MSRGAEEVARGVAHHTAVRTPPVRAAFKRMEHGERLPVRRRRTGSNPTMRATAKAQDVEIEIRAAADTSLMAECPLEIRDHKHRLDGTRVDCRVRGRYPPQGMPCQDATTCQPAAPFWVSRWMVGEIRPSVPRTGSGAASRTTPRAPRARWILNRDGSHGSENGWGWCRRCLRPTLPHREGWGNLWWKNSERMGQALHGGL